MSSIKKKKIMEINTINLVGRAGREPDVRYFESGSLVGSEMCIRDSPKSMPISRENLNLLKITIRISFYK